MKRVIILLAVAAVFAGCSKKVIKAVPEPVYAGPIQQEKPAVIVNDAPAPEPVAPARDPLRCTVLFDFDSDILQPAAAIVLDQYTADMAGKNVYLVGGACPIGDEYYNYQLGLRRAEAVKNFLIARVRPANIALRSVGEQSPVSTDPALYAKNRRCEITIE